MNSNTLRYTATSAIAWLLFGAIQVWAETTSPFAGKWVVNTGETDLLREDLDERTTLIQNPGKVRISVMGLPLPGGGSSGMPSHSPLSARDPAELRSEVMLIEVQAQRIMLNFPDLSGPDAMQIMPKGEFRGRKTTWSNRKIEQKYKTTERRVQKTWSIRSDGRLLVQVMIKPKGGKKRTLSRVFDRA